MAPLGSKTKGLWLHVIALYVCVLTIMKRLKHSWKFFVVAASPEKEPQ